VKAGAGKVGSVGDVKSDVNSSNKCLFCQEINFEIIC